MSPAELRMQPTIHFQSERGYFKHCIVLSTMALLPIILSVTTDTYEKVKIRRLKCIRTMRKQT
jgi:ABC-type phosphate transport system permease subunit